MIGASAPACKAVQSFSAYCYRTHPPSHSARSAARFRKIPAAILSDVIWSMEFIRNHWYLEKCEKKAAILMASTVPAYDLAQISNRESADEVLTKFWARFLSLAQSKLRLCSANHRPGYWSNLPCDWLSTAWAYSEQETENGPWFRMNMGPAFER